MGSRLLISSSLQFLSFSSLAYMCRIPCWIAPTLPILSHAVPAPPTNNPYLT